MAIGGCSRVPNKVFIQPQALYKALGFNDKNNDGVIEKKSIGTLWRNEGYKPEADINGDGKIVETEAKYFLQNQSNIYPHIKQAFSLTNEDRIIIIDLFKEKLSSIRSIEDVDSKGKINLDKALIKVNAIISLSELVTPALGKETIKQIFKEFHKTALSFIYPQAQARALEALVDASCDLGLIDDAIDIANTIKNSNDKLKMLYKVIIDINKSKLSKISIKELFAKTIQIANTLTGFTTIQMVSDETGHEIASRDCKIVLSEFIYRQMRKAGFSADEITALFKTNGINIKIRDDDPTRLIFE